MLTKCPKCHDLSFMVTGDHIDFDNNREIIIGECQHCGPIKIEKREWEEIQNIHRKWDKAK